MPAACHRSREISTYTHLWVPNRLILILRPPSGLLETSACPRSSEIGTYTPLMISLTILKVFCKPAVDSQRHLPVPGVYKQVPTHPSGFLIDLFRSSKPAVDS